MSQTALVTQQPDNERPLTADERPFDDTPLHTEDLPPTPTRDRNISAEAWIEAPPSVLNATAGLRTTDADGIRTAYKRRIGPWLLWRAGPARGADARYVAVDSRDLSTSHEFRLFPDGSGDGAGPSGIRHTRFRKWKEDLLGRD